MYQLESERLILAPWQDTDAASFQSLHADPMVMADQGGPIDAQASLDKLNRYCRAYEAHDFTRWCVRLKSGGIIGYCGVMPVRRQHPLGDHEEIGWRLSTIAWGYGYATEAAKVALHDVFNRTSIERVYSYTAADNLRSQSVMRKLNLKRESHLDFETPDPRLGSWRGLVWSAQRETHG